jgi:leucyl aminopeptidase
MQEHRDAMKSNFADLNNMGATRYGGSCQAAAFLENFIEKDTKWAHLDIAGPAM